MPTQETEEPKPVDPVAKGKTEVVVGKPTFGPWVNGKCVVTVAVTHEIDSTVDSWSGESRKAVRFWGLLQVDLAVTSNGFTDGTPKPGGGPKTIKYTFTVEDDWDFQLDATMTFLAKKTDPGNSTKDGNTGKVKAKKP
jgi:hypothetical protein